MVTELSAVNGGLLDVHDSVVSKAFTSVTR